MPVPSSHVDEGLKLTADGEVELWEISLKNIPGNGVAVLRFRDGPMDRTTSWNGKTWEHFAVKLSGYKKSAEAERSRPTLRLMNPLGVFNAPAFNRQFDGAIIQRYTVLRDHLERGLVIANNEIFFIGRVKDIIAGQSISFELRTLSDGPDQLVPARMYIPSEGFPFVTL